MIDSRDKPRGSTINLKGIDDRLKGSSRSRGTVDSHTQGRNRKTYPGIPIYEELLNRMTKRFENPRHSVQRPATQRGSERIGKDIRIETRKLEPHIPPRRGKTRSPSLACEDLADSSEFPSPTPHRSYCEAGPCKAPDSFFRLLLFFRAGSEEEEGGEEGLLVVLGTTGETPVAEDRPEDAVALLSGRWLAEETRGILPPAKGLLTGVS